MGNMADMRTRLNPDALWAAANTLHQMAEACEDCAGNGTTWSKACRDQELDPAKTRDMVLRLERCARKKRPLPDSLDRLDIMDGYEKFYCIMFGKDILGIASLPLDYQESVLYVLKETGLSDRESDILMRRFGIGDYDMPQTLEAISADISRTKDLVRQVELRALRKCHMKTRRDILVYGLEGYSLVVEAEKEANRRRLEQVTKDRLDKNSQMDIDEHIAEIITALDITGLEQLGLDVRSFNALKRAGIRSVLALIRKDDVEDIIRIRNMGRKSAYGTLDALDRYLLSRYGMKADTLRKACPGIMQEETE